MSSVVDVAEELGLNPALDLDLLWIVQEYLNAQLPENWVAVTYPDKSIHYINEALRVDVTESPILPRFKLLAKMMLRWKEKKEQPDEMTVLELLDPIDRVMDVKEMVEFMGIDPLTEPHLLWLAKLNVLEALPPGWQEQEMPDGAIVYLNVEEGYTTIEHPNDSEYKEILDREREKLKPYKSILPEYFVWPVTHYKKDIDQHGEPLTTDVIPCCGTYVDFYDIYGRHFWYDIVTDHVTMDVREVRYIPAVITLQRIWRGFKARKEIILLDAVVRRIVRVWKTARFRKAIKQAEQTRLAAVRCIQKVFRDKQVQIEESRLLFRRLGMVGSRPGKPVRRRIMGIMSSGYSFCKVRNSVILLQRLAREWLKRKRDSEYYLLHKEELEAKKKNKSSKSLGYRLHKSRTKKENSSDTASMQRAESRASSHSIVTSIKEGY